MPAGMSRRIPIAYHVLIDLNSEDPDSLALISGEDRWRRLQQVFRFLNFVNLWRLLLSLEVEPGLESKELGP